MLTDAGHRAFPPPTRPWVLAQSWRDLLFAHWSLPAAVLRERLPPGIVPDTFDGRAWLGVVPFRMAGVRLRGLPPIPGTHAFPELNVRTYVMVGETPGVFFFSLDATSRLAIATARSWFHLPYYRAEMDVRADGHAERGGFQYRCSRCDPRGGPAVFDAHYAPTGDVFHAQRNSLEHWLTERYCLFAVAPDGRVFRGDVHHAPWPLQPAEAEITRQTMLAAHGLAVEGAPESLLFARRIDVATWAPRVVYRPVAGVRHA
jgi:uncharacterized protein YqjF (DUF2071 family)